MARIKNELTLADLVLLRYIMKNPCTPKKALWNPKGSGGFWNLCLEMLGLIEAGHCCRVTSDHRFASTIATLRYAGLLEQGRKYIATPDATVLFLHIPKKELKWPLVISLNPDGSRNWDYVRYFEEQ